MIKEYNIENGSNVDIGTLKSPFMSEKTYLESHKGLVIPCHDIFIEYEGGILLVLRNNFPAKNIPWPIGGRVLRGVSMEESLRKKVKDETNLKLENIIELGVGRTFFKTDPFFHGKGTDTINIVYFGKGEGSLKLNNDHEEPTIVTHEKYSSDFRESLHPYVRDFMDKAMLQLT